MLPTPRVLPDIPMTIETPVALVHPSVVRANARRVVEYARGHGLNWRPHIKTHKCRKVAQIQLEAGARGLTVATPREAEVMASLCDDLLLAYPPVGDRRLERVLSLPDPVRLTVALDDRVPLEHLSRGAAARGRTVGVLVEVDLGMGRVGVAGIAAAVELASRAAGLPGVEYRGILFYPGHIRSSGNDADGPIRTLAGRLEELLEALAGAGVAPAVVSGGSTPFLWRSHELPGLTEIRSGTVIFNDRESMQSGVATRQDLAYSVLATVVSSPEPGRAVIDAGAKALAKEPVRNGLEGFGVLLEHPEVTLASLSEEHGVLDLSRSAWKPVVGERVRVVPNHVCVSVNLQDHLLAEEGSGWARWSLEARGREPWVGPERA
jgi:D-serine deaminase-like pyridoxal phosphate-dependent protein